MLTFRDNLAEVIQRSDIIFIVVGTTITEEGEADLRAVKAVAKAIGENLTSHKVIFAKSTVPKESAHIKAFDPFPIKKKKQEFPDLE